MQKATKPSSCWEYWRIGRTSVTRSSLTSTDSSLRTRANAMIYRMPERLRGRMRAAPRVQHPLGRSRSLVGTPIPTGGIRCGTGTVGSGPRMSPATERASPIRYPEPDRRGEVKLDQQGRPTAVEPLLSWFPVAGTATFPGRPTGTANVDHEGRAEARVRRVEGCVGGCGRPVTWGNISQWTVSWRKCRGDKSTT